jgi:hypothetical protein
MAILGNGVLTPKPKTQNPKPKKILCFEHIYFML